jgi:hypothetical protein
MLATAISDIFMHSFFLDMSENDFCGYQEITMKRRSFSVLEDFRKKLQLY